MILLNRETVYTWSFCYQIIFYWVLPITVAVTEIQIVFKIKDQGLIENLDKLNF